MTDPPRSETTDQRFYGLFEGIVTNVDDPLKEGRVKVTYPWFHDDMESDWAILMQFFAGPGHGAFFVPEVGSVVLCAARHGNLHQPIVVGGVYNGKDKPVPEHVRIRQIASVNGHKLTMLDSNGDNAGAVILEDASGSKVILSSTGHVTIKAVGALTLQAPHVRINGRVVSASANPI